MVRKVVTNYSKVVEDAQEEDGEEEEEGAPDADAPDADFISNYLYNEKKNPPEKKTKGWSAS